MTEPTTHKIAIVPFRINEAHALEYLVHLPKPKKGSAPEHMQWGIARGSVEGVMPNGDKVETRDVKAFALAKAAGATFEPVEEIIKREAMEELGLDVTDDMPMRSLGVRSYQSPSSPPYDIAFWGVQLPSDVVLQPAQDSQEVAFKTLEQLSRMAFGAPGTNLDERFKAGYIAILEEIEQQLLLLGQGKERTDKQHRGR